MKEATSFCDSALEAIEPYLEGDLAPAQARAFEAHAAGCAGCSRELALARRVLEGLRSLPEMPCPPEVEGQLPSREARPGTEPRVVPGRRWLAAAAALVLALVGAALIYRSPPLPVPEAEMAQAERDARLALPVLDSINRKATVSLRDRVLKEQVAALGENIRLRRFARIEVGE